MNIFSDLEREFNEKQANVQLLEKEVSEGRKRCSELEEELDQVNKEIGEARVSLFVFFLSNKFYLFFIKKFK
jgi:peptidoglycan hydrolase CwlO-like protein